MSDMILVVTATTKEMQAAFGFAGAPKVAQGETAEIEVGGKRLLLTVAGVGLVNTALTMGRLLERTDIKGVVNLGIAGAYDVEDFPLGTTCFVWQETWPEYGLLDESGAVDARAIGFAQGTAMGQEVWNRVRINPTNDAQTMGLTLPEKARRAAAISVSSVTGTPDRAGWLKMAHHGDIENMEGFGAAYATLGRELPFLELRTVSNLVGSRHPEDWDLKGALESLGESAKTLFMGR